jgi:hypothetical protein
MPALLLVNPGCRPDETRLFYAGLDRRARGWSRLAAVSSEPQKYELQATGPARFNVDVSESKPLQEICVASLTLNVIAGIEAGAVVVDV